MAGTTTDQSGDPSGLGAVHRALGYLRSYKLESGGAFVALLLVTAANLATPLLIGRAIDDGISPRQLNVLLVMVAGLVGVRWHEGFSLSCRDIWPSERLRGLLMT